MDKTHEECKKEFVELLEVAINGIKAIDKETVYSVREPKWWSEMMDLKRIMQDSVNNWKTNY